MDQVCMLMILNNHLYWLKRLVLVINGHDKSETFQVDIFLFRADHNMSLYQTCEIYFWDVEENSSKIEKQPSACLPLMWMKRDWLYFRL